MLKSIIDQIAIKVSETVREILDSIVISKGHVSLDVGKEQVLIDSNEPGMLTGFLNAIHVVGPNQAELIIELYSPTPSFNPEKREEWTKVQHTKLVIEPPDSEPNVFTIEPIFVPYGCVVTLKHTSGLNTPYYYHMEIQ